MSVFNIFKQHKHQGDPKAQAMDAVLKALAALQAKEYRKAIKLFDSAIALDPSREDAWSNKGLCHHECNEFSDAIYCLQKSLAINPAFGMAWYNMGNSLSKKDEKAKAIDAYERAANAADGIDNHFRARALHNRGLIETDQEQHQAAQKSFRRSLEFDPNMTKSKVVLFNALITGGGTVEEMEKVVGSIHDAEYEGLTVREPDGAITIGVLRNNKVICAYQVKPRGVE